MRFLSRLCIMIAVSVLVLAGTLLWKTDQVMSRMAVRDSGSDTVAGVPDAFVLLGVDTRGKYGGGLTDVMILVAMNRQKQVMLLSIPRDTYVVIPGESYGRKINSIYKHGNQSAAQPSRKGMEGGLLVEKTLSSIYGIPVQHYILMNFEGFKGIVDAMGGITVNVDRRMIYHDKEDGTSIDLYSGVQTLNGENALNFVRFRHDDRGARYFSSDFERNARQQLVIKTLLGKMISLSAVPHLFEILNLVGDNVQTDFSKESLEQLAWDFSTVNSAGVQVLPNPGQFWDVKSDYVYIPRTTLDRQRTSLQQFLGVRPRESLHYNNSPSL